MFRRLPRRSFMHTYLGMSPSSPQNTAVQRETVTASLNRKCHRKRGRHVRENLPRLPRRSGVRLRPGRASGLGTCEGQAGVGPGQVSGPGTRQAWACVSTGRPVPRDPPRPRPRGARALTVEVEDEEAAVGEVAVEREQHAAAGAARRLQGRVPAEDAQLRGALVRPVPAERGARVGSGPRRGSRPPPPSAGSGPCPADGRAGRPLAPGHTAGGQSWERRPEPRLTSSGASDPRGRTDSSDRNTVSPLPSKRPHFKI